ncbi:MAG TPA: succinate dehydrogenase, hydrophobic membrane anchor protein [Steroidobacteraceae bacterium]|nr:succinate dehydrogenase, hydrophobic membrane anchor protein [Steroidobacteraceae bacterium]
MRRSSALGRVLGNGSAKHGVDNWWVQRVTALALVPLGVWFGVSLLLFPRFDYGTLTQWINHGWNAVLLVALVLVIARHSYLGVRVVVEDYVHPPGARMVTLLVLQFAHVLIAVMGVLAVLKVALGNATFGDSA